MDASSSKPTRSRLSWLNGIFLSGALILAAAFVFGASRSVSEEGRPLPAPALDEPVAAAVETAVFAGGCFWGVQGVFQHVAGVKEAVSGHAGGKAEDAKDQVVGTGRTGHAESDRSFYAAEAYHQNFLTLNPSYPYIVINDMPKIENLKRLYPEAYRTEPVLVAVAKPTH